VVRELASARGGEVAVAEALAAHEIATIQLQGGIELFGILARRLGDASASHVLVLCGGARAQLGGFRAEADSIYAVLGAASPALAELQPGPIDLQLSRGVRLRGVLDRVQHASGEAAALLVLRSGELLAGTELEARLESGAVVALAPAALGAHAGAPSDFFAPTELPCTLVPKSRSLPPREGAMLGLYEAAHAALRSSLGSQILPVFERLHRQLERDFKNDWLLRWNLLESLQKLGLDGELADALRGELTKLEVYYEYKQPIASGLRYLASMLGRPAA
jgi:hypothetical protein